jgi:hypothetical protein
MPYARKPYAREPARAPHVTEKDYKRVRTRGPAPIQAQSICDLATEFACMENCNLAIIIILIVSRSSIKFTPFDSKQEGCSAERDSIVRKSSETRFLRDFCPSGRHRAAQKPGFLAHRNENRSRKASGRSSVGVASPQGTVFRLRQQ